MRMIAAKLKWLLLLPALVLGLLAFAPGTASAQLLDPATLHINGGTAYLYNNNTEVHGVNSGLVNVTQIASTNKDNLYNPWYLILGIPDVTKTNATITSINGTTLGTPIAGTYETSMTSSTADAYTLLQGVQGSGILPQTDASNNWTNWSGADSALNGITATSFGLFEFQISATLAPGATDSFQFSGLPVGTFVIAYGRNATHDYDTAFTEAGLATTGQNTAVPEPSTIALALSGLVGVGFAGLRRLRRPQAATM